MLLGAHESVAGAPQEAFSRGDADGCEAIQIFARSRAQWKTAPLDPSDRAAFVAARRARGWPTMSHASYLINLCAIDPVILEKSRAALEEEMVRAEELGLDYVVLHPGAHRGCGEEPGLLLIAASLDWLEARTRGFRTRLLLETTAGQGSCLGCRFEQLGRLFAITKRADRLGVCFDTCHAFAAGYDLTSDEGYDATFAAFDKAIGLSALLAFHLNDSKTPLGSRVDRHAQIGEGHLGLQPFWRLVNDARFARLPGVVETPPSPGETSSFARNIARLKALRGAAGPRLPVALAPAPLVRAAADSARAPSRGASSTARARSARASHAAPAVDGPAAKRRRSTRA